MEVEALRGRAVVSLHQARKLGEIQDVLLNVQEHRIAALTLRGGLFHGGPVISWSDVHSVGLDAVMVDDADAVHRPAREPQPGEMAVASLHGMKVVTDEGELVGTIEEVDVDSTTGNVIQYVVESVDTTIFHSGPRILVPPRAVVAFGADLATVHATVLDLKRKPAAES